MKWKLFFQIVLLMVIGVTLLLGSGLAKKKLFRKFGCSKKMMMHKMQPGR